MTRQLWIFILIAMIASPVALSLAQGNGGGGIIEMRRLELERTDQLIERAREALQASGDPTGAHLLEQAQTMQEQAWEQFRSNQYQAAHTLTMQARALLKRALAKSRHDDQTESLVARHLERAGEKLDQAQEYLSQTDDKSLLALYDVARDNLKRAWEFYNKQQYAPADKLADQAEKAAEKILGSRGGNQEDGSYERRHDMVVEAVQQAREVLATCGSEKGQNMLHQAEKALETAETMAGKNRTTAAMQALQRAREFAVRATRECRGGELLQTRYDRLVSQADLLKEKSLSLSGSTREAVDGLLIQAYEQLALARGYIDSGESEKALAALQAASLALRQADTYIAQGS